MGDREASTTHEIDPGAGSSGGLGWDVAPGLPREQEAERDTSYDDEWEDEDDDWEDEEGDYTVNWEGEGNQEDEESKEVERLGKGKGPMNTHLRWPEMSDAIDPPETIDPQEMLTASVQMAEDGDIVLPAKSLQLRTRTEPQDYYRRCISMFSYFSSNTHLVPRLPIELFERIIDHCYLSNAVAEPTLLACALVCRSWTPRSIWLIYKHVVLFNNNYQQFVDCLRLRFNCDGIRVRRLHLDTRGDNQFPVHLPLSQLISVMNDFESVDFRATELATLHSCFFATLPQYKSVTKVILDDVAFTSFSQFARLVMAFPSLKQLRVAGFTRWKDRNSPSYLIGSRRSKKVQLEKLYLFANPSSPSTIIDATNWLCTTSTPLSLWKLSLDDTVTNESAQAVNRLLKASINLSYLRLRVAEDRNAPDYLDDIDVQHNHNLQTIKLVHEATIRALDQFARMLSRLSPVSLRSVNMVIWVAINDVDNFMNVATWTPFDDLLSGSQFSSLSEVSVAVDVIQGFPHEKFAAFELEHAFPRLSARGIISLSLD